MKQNGNPSEKFHTKGTAAQTKNQNSTAAQSKTKNQKKTTAENKKSYLDEDDGMF